MANKKDVPVEGMQENGVEKAEAKATVKEKVYNFVCSNKYLTVASLGVQFINGKATVKDLSVARALATIDDVTLVED